MIAPPEGPVRTAYVSSTYLDLGQHRQRAAQVLRCMGWLDIAMEHYVAEDRRSLDRCLADVASCDLYIGLFAWRYGWVPPPTTRGSCPLFTRCWGI